LPHCCIVSSQDCFLSCKLNYFIIFHRFHKTLCSRSVSCNKTIVVCTCHLRHQAVLSRWLWCLSPKRSFHISMVTEN
jgi:hypothetical protein